jgi:hypothetical protein
MYRHVFQYFKRMQSVLHTTNTTGNDADGGGNGDMRMINGIGENSPSYQTLYLAAA